MFFNSYSWCGAGRGRSSLCPWCVSKSINSVAIKLTWHIKHAHGLLACNHVHFSNNRVLIATSHLHNVPLQRVCHLGLEQFLRNVRTDPKTRLPIKAVAQSWAQSLSGLVSGWVVTQTLSCRHRHAHQQYLRLLEIGLVFKFSTETSCSVFPCTS